MNGEVELGNASEIGSIGFEEAKAELARILNDERFACTGRNKRFLRFVTQEFLEGRAANVKAYSIAVDVFGSPSTFDPSTDPIVRIEATRLRACLDRYYERFGAPLGVRIELPKGNYVPLFSKPGPISADTARSPVAAESRKGKEAAYTPQRRGVLWPLAPWFVFAIASGAAAIGWYGIAVLGPHSGLPLTGKPVVDLVLTSDLPDPAKASTLQDSVAAALSNSQNLRVREIEANGVRSADTELAGTGANRYLLEIRYLPNSREPAAWWKLSDRKTGEVFGSGTESADGSGKALSAPLGTAIAARVAGPAGLIAGVETARELVAPSLGNGCVLRSALALRTADENLLGTARDCLETTLEAQPGNSDAYAYLAMVLIAAEMAHASTSVDARAATMANTAAALSPRSDRAAYAQMLARLTSGDVSGAIAAGRRAVSLNPANAEAAARLGIVLIAIGDWRGGVELINSVASRDDGFHLEAEVGLALDSYRTGKYRETLAHLNAVPGSCAFLTHVLRAAALGQIGDKSAPIAVRDLETEHGADLEAVRSFLAFRQFSPPLARKISEGIGKAGQAGAT